MPKRENQVTSTILIILAVIATIVFGFITMQYLMPLQSVEETEEIITGNHIKNGIIKEVTTTKRAILPKIPGFTRYIHPNHNYTLSINEKIFAETQFTCEIPVSENQTIKDTSATMYSHTIALEYTDEKGDLQKELTDISVEICFAEENYKNLANYYEGDHTVMKIKDKPALKVEMGAEGRGANIFYISLDDANTLVISHNYVSETYDPALTDNDDFLSFNEQDTIVKSILESLKT